MGFFLLLFLGKMFLVNPIWPGKGGCQFYHYPQSFFCGNSKSSFTRKLKFSGFSNLNILHTYGLKLGFYAYCLNALFYLYQTKSILRLTSKNWISTLYSSFETFEKSKQIAQCLQRNFAQTPLKGICTFLVFIECTFRFYKFCWNWIRWIKSFLKLNDLLQFAQFFCKLYN